MKKTALLLAAACTAAAAVPFSASADDAKVYRKIAEMRGGVLNSRLTTMNETENFLELLSKNGL